MKLLLLIVAILVFALGLLLCLIDPTWMAAATHTADLFFLGLALFAASFLPIP